jgi:hypothetical protein
MTKEIFIKGRNPKNEYSTNLKEIFASYEGQVFSYQSARQLLNNLNFKEKLDTKSILDVIEYRNNITQNYSENSFFSFAGPFTMEAVLDSHFIYNLDYQDSVIKVEIEKAEEKHNLTLTATERNVFATEIFHLVSVVLHTDYFSNNRPLYLSLTNLELDYIILKCLTFFKLGNIVSIKDLISIGNTANELACKTQKSILSQQNLNTKDILTLNIYSGVIWWSDIEIQKQYNLKPSKTIMELEAGLLKLAKHNLPIDDFDLFNKDILHANNTTKILYFLDDNGELVWDLLLMQNLIKINKNLYITCVVHNTPISNTANYNTLSHILKNNDDCHFDGLKHQKRFRILREANKITAFDPRFMSNKLSQELQSTNIVISKGASNFEKLQYVPIPIYYLFTVYSKISTILTGLKQYSGVFAKANAESVCFKNIYSYNSKIEVETNLKNLRTSG